MPQVLNPQTLAVAEVSEQQYEQAWNTPQGSEAYKLQEEGVDKVRLWDAVDGTWTGPISLSYALQYHLRKVVSRCSGCKWTSAYSTELRGIKAHIAQVRSHWTAQVTPFIDGSGNAGLALCTGCGGRAKPMPLATAQKHIKELQDLYESHRAVEEVVQRRFAMRPTENIIIGKRPVEGLEDLTPKEPVLVMKKAMAKRLKKGEQNGVASTYG